MTPWILTALIAAAYVAYRIAGAHARRVERDQREIAAYKPFVNPGDHRVESSRWAARDKDGGA